MVTLKTVNGNLHKYLKLEMKQDFDNFENKMGSDAFENTQALLFLAISGKKPAEKNQELFKDLVECYCHIPEYKALVDKGLDHLTKTYGNQVIDLGDKVASGKTYFKEVKKQLISGDFDFNALGVKKQEEFNY